MKKVFGVMLLALTMISFCGDRASAAISDCEQTHGSGQKKMEQERKKQEERRQENYPDPEETEEAMNSCLGGIGGVFGGGMGFPKLPSYDDIIDKVCREARKKISQKVGESASFYNDPIRGSNTVRQWDGALNKDIWDALQ